MAQQQEQTTETKPGSLRDAGLLDNAARILNELAPLKGADHHDVVEYRVEIPMRYAECFAILADGRKIEFEDPQKFLGWSSHEARRSLLFRNNDSTLEVEIDNHAAERECSTVRSVNLQAAIRSGAERVKKFIGIDGELLLLPAV